MRRHGPMATCSAEDPENWVAGGAKWAPIRDELEDMGWNKLIKDAPLQRFDPGLFPLKGGKLALTREYKFFKGKVVALNWAPGSVNQDLSNRLVAADQDGRVTIINAKKGSRNRGYTCRGPAQFVQAVALHAEKDIVLSGGMDNTIALYKPEDEKDPTNPFRGRWPWNTSSPDSP